MDIPFQLTSTFEPSGDQPDAIKVLAEGVQAGIKDQVLLGVTGSGKTFTMANVIREVQRPSLIIAPNKTLAAQLFSEFVHLCFCQVARDEKSILCRRLDHRDVSHLIVNADGKVIVDICLGQLV